MNEVCTVELEKYADCGLELPLPRLAIGDGRAESSREPPGAIFMGRLGREEFAFCLERG